MLRTKTGLPRYCCWAIDRHGKRRVRFRRDGFTTYLTVTPWGEEFMRAYAAALDGAQAGNIGAHRTKPGTVNALAVAYYRSPEFRGLKATTQVVRRGIIERFRVEHGHNPVRLLGRQHIKAIIGAKASTPEAANNLLKVLRLLLAFAVDAEMIDTNPAIGVKKFKSVGDGFHTWTEDEISAFEARHPVGSKARFALALLLYTAQRRGDVVRMGWQHVNGDAIAVRQEKTDSSLLIPMHPELQAVLRAAPKSNMTFLVTELGAPFTAAGFGGWFRDRCNEAGLPHCSAHGLRKATATRLADAGATIHEIMSITGHRSMSAVAPYTSPHKQ